MEAYNVKVMQSALEDMTGIKEYIEEQFKEPQIASEMFDGISKTILSLDEMPRRNPRLENVEKEYRVAAYKGCRIIYKIDGNDVTVVNVKHSLMNF